MGRTVKVHIRHESNRTIGGATMETLTSERAYLNYRVEYYLSNLI